MALFRLSRPYSGSMIGNDTLFLQQEKTSSGNKVPNNREEKSRSSRRFMCRKVRRIEQKYM